MKRLGKQLWMILTLNCEDSARLTSESLDRPLNWAEAWAVGLHRVVCSKSRRLNRQLIQLHDAIKNQPQIIGQSLGQSVGQTDSPPGLSSASSMGLSAEAKARIRSKLDSVAGFTDDRESHD